MDQSLTLVPLSFSHFNLIRKWRNDNKKYFLSQKEVSLWGHLKWFVSWKIEHLLNKDKFIYIIQVDGKPVGMIGIDIDNEWSATIQRVLLADTTLARSGVMSTALEMVIELHKVHLYRLEVLRDNVKAIAFYKKNKFFIEEDQDPQIVKMKRYYEED